MEIVNTPEGEIRNLFNAQKAYQRARVTDKKARKNQLKKLKEQIKAMEGEICAALKADLGKSEEESYMTEIGQVYTEITHMVKHLGKYSKNKKVRTPLANFPAKSYVKNCPYGAVLIISPWNYPFLLTIGPLVDAIAAGNSVILKPSELSPNTSLVMQKLIQAAFPAEVAAVVQGDKEVSTQLLNLNFDYIFYTGGITVGKIVLKTAAERLIPVTLELGGKSPCVVDETANIPLAARRIVFGKLLNAGQTCIAPDYIYCAESVKERLVAAIKEQIAVQYGEKPLQNPAYPKIINARHFNRIRGYILPEKVLVGGEADEAAQKIAPTLVDADFTDAVMQEEIFGPVLPVVTFKTIDEAIEKINGGTTPLAAYIFSSSKSNINKMLNFCDFGGGCVNDTIMHIANDNLPFGGRRESGMGAYHGARGFKTFTHEKSVVRKSTKLDLPIRYQPLTKLKYFLIKLFLK